MDLSDWFEGEALFIPPLEALLRLGMAALFGSVIGIDREARNKPAGLRTHMLTAPPRRSTCCSRSSCITS